jgi:hypothetical protein
MRLFSFGTDLHDWSGGGGGSSNELRICARCVVSSHPNICERSEADGTEMAIDAKYRSVTCFGFFPRFQLQC